MASGPSATEKEKPTGRKTESIVPIVPVTKLLTLAFHQPALEGEYLSTEAKSRWPILIVIFCFDIFCYAFRVCAGVYMHCTSRSQAGVLTVLVDVGKEIGPQLANMTILYVLIGLLNWRSRRLGFAAARQEELLLSACMALAICSLLFSLDADNASDYVYAAFFLICTSTFLKIRWWIGTMLLSVPTIAAIAWKFQGNACIVPRDAIVHITVAWAVGGLMAYLAEWYRRQMFASQKMAEQAHEKELIEAKARIKAQRQLAAALAQTAHRALSAAREKASNEAKSDFMSLMCHEVRTPLNGCLASAEMLLDTPLQEEQRELAKTICVSGSILLSTVSNFLDFFKLEAGKALDIVRTEVNLADLVSDVHCIIEAMIGGNGEVRLLDPNMDGVPTHVICDPDRVRSILLNLYTNAAKFTRSGHIGLKVSVVPGPFQPTADEGYSMVTASTSNQKQPPKLASQPASGIRVAPIANRSTSLDLSTHADTPSLLVSCSEGEHSLVMSSSHYAGHLGAAEMDSMSLPGVMWTTAECSSASASINSARRSTPTDESNLSTGRRASGLQNLQTLLAGGQGGTHRPPVGTKAGLQQQPAMWPVLRHGGPWEDPARASVGSESETAANTLSGSTGVNETSSSISSQLHHTQPPQEPQRMFARGLDQPKLLLFEVIDTGIGIGPKELKALFNEYVQGTDDEMRKPRTKGGTGLGLSICSKQVGVLGGCIGACSCPGVGSKFWFTMPLLPALSPVPGGRLLHAFAPGQSQPMPHIAEGCGCSHSSPSDDCEKLRASCPKPAGQAGNSGSDGESNLANLHSKPSAAFGSEISATVAPPHPEDAPGQQDLSAPRLLPGLPIPANSHRQSVDSNLVTDNSFGFLISGLRGAQGPGGQTTQYQLSSDLSCSSGKNIASATHDSRTDAVDSAGHSTSSHGATAHALNHAGGEAAPAVAADGPANSSGPMNRASSTSSNNSSVRMSLHEGSQMTGPVSGGLVETRRLSRDSSVSSSVMGLSHLVSRFSHQHDPGMGGIMIAGQSTASSKSTVDLAFFKGRRALLVEDNLINQTVARKMLHSMGMLCEVASNGLEAVHAIERTLQHDRPAEQVSEPLPRDCNSRGSSSSPQPAAPAALTGRASAEVSGTAGGAETPSASAAATAQATAAAAQLGSSKAHLSTPFDVVLMDMSMPVMGGVDATRAIRALGCKVPIVAMTANASDRDRDECQQSGMDWFLSKPVLKDMLSEALEFVMASRSAASSRADSGQHWKERPSSLRVQPGPPQE